MKTLPTLATGLLAVLLVLAPSVAYAATITVSTDRTSYSGSATITVSGTVTPAPSTDTAAVITTKNPNGAQVDIGTASVSTSNGAYSYSFVAGGTANWIAGTYTVNATWGSGTNTAKATTTFTYTAGATTTTGAAQTLIVQVQSPSPAWPGQKFRFAVLVSWSNGSLADASFVTVHYHTPDNTLVTCGASGSACSAFTRIHKGFYYFGVDLPANSPNGGYFIHAWAKANVAAGTSQDGHGLGSFTVNSAIANSDQVSAIKSAVDSLSSALTSVQNSVNGIASTVTNVQGAVNSIQSGVSGLTNLSGLGNKVDSVNTAVQNSQTYVLVVAALAAITLVLELAILVRKLS
jgi:hypothetical protein